MASNRVLSHQLSNGLYVSGAPEHTHNKDRVPGMPSTAMPYTGGDVKKSGELGKMFDIHVRTKKSGQLSGCSVSSNISSLGSSSLSSTVSGRTGSFRNSSSAASNAASLNNAPSPSPQPPPPPPQITHLGSFSTRHTSHSGPLPKMGDVPRPSKMSGPASRQNSGPLPPSNLPATGLIVSSAPTSRSHSGPIEANPVSRTQSIHSNSKNPSSQAINHLSSEQSYSAIHNLPRVVLWTIVPLFIIGFVAGIFILAAVHDSIFLIVVAFLLCLVIMVLMWNAYMGRKAVLDFVAQYPEFGLDDAKDGQYVKIKGIVTCGSVPLESSYQKMSRCVYTSCGLYEYRNLKSKSSIPKHRIFTWALRYMERQVVDFYISDYKSGLRALVKAGNGAAVTPYVEDNSITSVTNDTELSPNFLHWLSEHKLSADNCILRLKEGCIKEGSTVTVMGMVQKTDNVLTIVPPTELVSTGCQWKKLFLPSNLCGIILICQDSLKDDVVPV